MSTSASEPPTALLVDDLSISYGGGHDVVSHVDLTIAPGEILGVIGESGSGKSSIAMAVMGLLPASARVRARELQVAGTDLVGLAEPGFGALRGSLMSMIFQEPMSALNPVMRLGQQIAESLLLHTSMNRREAHERALELMRLVRMPDPELRMRQFPHQISGGQRQRVMIAIAMASRPALLLADEPTTALDVTIQAQILELIKDLARETRTGVMLISHDLGVIGATCDKIIVMYGGRVVERGAAAQVLAAPAHAYTRALLASTPTLDIVPREDLPTIPAAVHEELQAMDGGAR